VCNLYSNKILESNNEDIEIFLPQLRKYIATIPMNRNINVILDESSRACTIKCVKTRLCNAFDSSKEKTFKFNCDAFIDNFKCTLSQNEQQNKNQSPSYTCVYLKCSLCNYLNSMPKHYVNAKIEESNQISFEIDDNKLKKIEKINELNQIFKPIFSKEI